MKILRSGFRGKYVQRNQIKIHKKYIENNFRSILDNWPSRSSPGIDPDLWEKSSCQIHCTKMS